MKKVNFTVNGRNYHLACKPEEEAYLLELTAELDRRASAIADKGADKGETMSDSQMLLMLAVSLLDELKENAARDAEEKAAFEKMVAPLETLAERAEKLAKSDERVYKEIA